MNIPAIITYPAVPNPISGPSTICGGTTVTYSTTAANALSYTWTVTGTGLSIASGQGTNTVSVNVQPGFGQGSIQVYSSNCISNSAVRGMVLTGIPLHSNAITGPTFVCANSTATYSMPVVTGATSYQWSLTGDVTLGASSVTSTTTSQTFIFGPNWTTGTLTVTALNACGTYSRILAINSYPTQPGSMAGLGAGLCGLSNQVYSIVPVAGATAYTWTVPAGVSIVNNTGTSVTLNFTSAFTSNSANICVAAQNSCGVGPQRCYTVTSRPAIPTITGNASVCKSNTSVHYTAASASSVSSYAWSVVGGAGLTPSGASTNVNFTTSTANPVLLKVIANNTCGASQPGQLYVSVNSACRGTLEEVENGTNEFVAYPNPTSGKVSVVFSSKNNEKVVIKLTDLLGNVLRLEEVVSVDGLNTDELDMSDLPKGIYILNLIIEDSSESKMIIRQ
jgi:hypothetical protein